MATTEPVWSSNLSSALVCKGNAMKMGLKQVVGTIASALFVVAVCQAQGDVVALAKSDPAKLVSNTIENELKHANEPTKYMYKDRRQTLHVITTKEMVETTDGTVARLIAFN